jgi:hypothetical protein
LAVATVKLHTISGNQSDAHEKDPAPSRVLSFGRGRCPLAKPPAPIS